MKLSLSNIRIPMPAPLDHVLIDGDFCNDTGRWRCERLYWITVVDSIGREYFAGDDVAGFRNISLGIDKKSEKDLDSLKEIINREHFALIREACNAAACDDSGSTEEVSP